MPRNSRLEVRRERKESSRKVIRFGFSSAPHLVGDFIFMSLNLRNASSISTPSVKKKTRKIQGTRPKREQPLSASHQPELVSRPSNSRLSELFKDREFRLKWDNDVAYQVATNIISLRKFRGLSQSAVAEKMGTSQAAIARIESAEENITVGTLRRLIGALDGRLRIAIYPAEAIQECGAWVRVDAEAVLTSSTNPPWILKAAAHRKTRQTEQLLAGYERPLENTTANLLTEGGVR